MINAFRGRTMEMGFESMASKNDFLVWDSMDNVYKGVTHE